MAGDDQRTAKRAAGRAAADRIENGMKIGLGTGSTVTYAIEAIGRRVQEWGLDVLAVPSSLATERLARKQGIPLTTLSEAATLDLALDGADEVDPNGNLIKGGGAAHTRERIVATQARQFLVLIDETKQVERLGQTVPLPVEVLPMAVAPVMRALEISGGRPEVREGTRKHGPIITDQGFWVIDVHFEEGIDDPQPLAETIKALPGVLDHGLFLNMATDILMGTSSGDVRQI